MFYKFPSIFLLFIFDFVLQFAFGQPPEPITVSTKYGQLKGFVHFPSDASRKIDVFFGIPYAKAPLGELRLEAPVAPSNWANVRDAGEEAKPPACPPHARPDTPLNFNEDCLFLNVFAPHREPDDHSLSPVLFVIHGGAYEIASSAKYFNYDLLGSRFVSKGVVFVSINYRLGVLGFATTGDKELPGNYGIRDQIAALEYVKENIQAFGGDPNKVTVLGYSAGSGSTGLLSTTPLAKDLFQQSVRMSGAILSPSCSGTRVPKVTRELADALNCQSTPVKKCLQQKSVEEIFDGVQKLGPAPISYVIAKFSPNRMDHALFPLDYPKALEKAPPKRTMLGFTELDFLLMTLIMERNSSINMLALTDEQIAQYDQTHFEAFLRNYVAKSEYFDDQSNAIRADLLDFYANKYEKIDESKKDASFFLRLYSMVCSDLMMVIPMLWETQIRVGNAGWPIYLYEYKYINHEVFPKRVPVPVHIAYHDYDHDLLFNKNLIKNGQDVKISEFLIDSVVNFVKTGDPSNKLAKWETTPAFSLADAKTISHMEIGATPVQKQGMEGELKRLHFWMEMRKKYGHKYDLVRGIFGNGTAANYGRMGIVVWMIAIVAIFVSSFLISNTDYLCRS